MYEDHGRTAHLRLAGLLLEPEQRKQLAEALLHIPAQAGNAARPTVAVDSATPDVRDGILAATIVDGGVALPADTDDENGEE